MKKNPDLFFIGTSLVTRQINSDHQTKQKDQNMKDQHKSDKINRQCVIEKSADFLLRQIQNQKLHAANLLAKTGDVDSYSYLTDVFKDFEEAIREISEISQTEIRTYYLSQQA